MHQIVERVDRDYLLAHYGHDEFVLARTEALILLGNDLDQGRPVSVVDRVKVGPVEVYEEFRSWAEDYSDLDFKSIAARVDIENLSRWLLAVLYCSNHDPFQGSLLLDLRQPNEQWFWLLWDFDASFLRSDPRRLTLESILETPTGDYPPDERHWLLKQLIDTSPDYRNYLAHLFVEITADRSSRNIQGMVSLKQRRLVIERFARVRNKYCGNIETHSSH